MVRGRIGFSVCLAARLGLGESDSDGGERTERAIGSSSNCLLEPPDAAGNNVTYGNGVRFEQEN